MMQWLRRNTKQIMVVVVLLAMFSFVGAQGLYALLAPNPLNDVAFKAFGREYTRGDLQEAQIAGNILDNMGFGWKPTNDRDFSPQHWFLLIEEARRAGLQPSSATIEEMMSLADETWAEAGGRAAWRKRVDAPLPQVRSAIGLKVIESQNASRVLVSAAPSEPEVRKYVRDTQDKITIKTAVFDAANWVNEDETFSEEQMQAHFDKYRDVYPDESEDGFGYKFPRRVTIQYVIADPMAIAEGIEISQEAAIDYWKRNKSKYTKRVPVDTMGPVDSETPPEMKQVTMKFSEARDGVQRELKQQKALGLARRALDELSAKMGRAWLQQSVDEETGFRTMPAGGDSIDAMEQAKADIEAKHGITLRYGTLELVTAEQIANNPSLGQARLPGEGDVPMTIAELAFRVPGFFKPEAKDETSARLQLFQTPNSTLVVRTPDPKGGFEIVDGRIAQKMIDGRFITFRVIDAREESAPESLNEVREDVLADLRLQSAYERMNDDARKFAAVAQKIGADRALAMFDELRTERGIFKLDTPKAFARRTPQQLTAEQLEAGESPLLPASVNNVGRSEKFIDECFAMTTEGWSPEPINVDSEKVAQAAAESADADPKVQLIDLPKQKIRVVVDLQNYQPVDVVAYETQHRQNAFNTLRSQRMAVLRSQWFDPQNITARCNYVDLQPTNEEDAKDEAAS